LWWRLVGTAAVWHCPSRAGMSPLEAPRRSGSLTRPADALQHAGVGSRFGPFHCGSLTEAGHGLKLAAPTVRPARSNALAPLTGVVAVALLLLGALIHDVIGDVPDGDAPAAEFASYYQEEDGSIWWASLPIFVGIGFFLWFVGALRGALHEVEGGVGRLASTAHAGGIATAVLIFAGFGTQVSAAILVSDRDAR
jgi:hypothetical protein